MKMVDVNVSVLPPPAPRTVRYAVLIDKKPEEIAAWQRLDNNGEIIVIVFFTGAVAEIPDYSGLTGWVLPPYFVGNLNPVRSAIDQIVDYVVDRIARRFCDVSECVLDDRIDQKQGKLTKQGN